MYRKDNCYHRKEHGPNIVMGLSFDKDLSIREYLQYLYLWSLIKVFSHTTIEKLNCSN
jgi:hypothetical protein